ncbi:MAG: condensation domain-containing protein, partial [Cyanobacteria bacterium P01_A01_bin.135]
LEGDLDTGAFKQAWQTVVERHPVLRTAFYWEEADKPLQVVYAGAELPWIEADWQSLSPEAQAARLEEFLQGDRAQGFSLDQAPMMRCALFQLGPTQYRFVWSHHHLLMDGWCNALLIKEVIAVYTALRQGRSLTLPPTRPYRDYILWLQQQDPTAAEAYWRSALRDFAAPTPLGIGRSTSTRTTEPSAAEPLATEHREQQVSLPQSLTADLRAFVAAHRLTLNTLTQGAWALALSRYSGLSDVVFGATVSGRPPTLPGANAIVGLFINTVPVRVTLPAQTPLLLWLQQIQTDQRDRETYAYSALTDIQFWTDVPQGEPLFESLLVFENYPVSLDAALTDDSSGLTIRDGRGFEQTSYSLALVAIPGETLSIRANYDGDRFTAAEIERLLGHLEAALSGMVADPQQPIDALPLLTNKEQQLIESWNQTERPVPEQYVHEVIAAQAVERPEAIAVVFEEISLSYEELDRRVSELAGYLQQSVKPGDRVAFCLERSPLLVVVVLAILKAGAAYVPLDPTYPAERLRFILGDARVSLLLHDGGLPFDGDGVAAIDISGIGADGDRISTIDPPAPVRATGHTGYAHAARTPLPLSHGDHPTTPHDLAYLIYTSGSTGTPKGVPIRHHSLTNLLTSMAQAPGMGSSDTLLAVTTPAFDIAALELLLPLTVG